MRRSPLALVLLLALGPAAAVDGAAQGGQRVLTGTYASGYQDRPACLPLIA